MNANLRTAARGHSADMAARNYFSHVSFDGRSYVDRILGAGYTLSGILSENIAAGQWAPDVVVDAWMASPAHCQNIMNGAFKSVGVGYAFSVASTYAFYWTQDFGGS
jgi:uncharacterized protein YkwD